MNIRAWFFVALSFLILPPLMEADPADANPIDTRRRFKVEVTSHDILRRRIDVETTCGNGEG